MFEEMDNGINTNMVFDYAFYMMFSSYFRSMKCENKDLIQTLYENYLNAGNEAQYEAEDLIIPKIENEILKQKDFIQSDEYDLILDVTYVKKDEKCRFVANFNNKRYEFKLTPVINPDTKIITVEINVKKLRK